MELNSPVSRVAVAVQIRRDRQHTRIPFGCTPVMVLELTWPSVPEYVANIPALLFVPLLWYWVGSRLDRRWGVADRAPWIGLFFFMLISLAGAFLPIGYTGYLPYGLAIWLVTAVVIRLVSKPAPNVNRKQ